VPFSGVVFNGIAGELIVKHHRTEREAARIFAYASAAAYDANIGCFDTKFTHWYIRPSKADAAITTPVGLPNHPSYPSAHSCETGAWEAVLVDAFPSERESIVASAQEAGLSRLYGGIHYRFDMVAGETLGLAAGRLALQRGGLE
jgi:membrane-associated phospholipid phosphatase